MNGPQVIVKALELSRDWAFQLADDLADAPMETTLPNNAGHHAMWIIGHAAHSEGGLMAMITGDHNPLESWGPHFQQGSQPTSDPSKYPPYREVLDQFKRLRAQTIAYTQSRTDADLDAKPRTVLAEIAEYEFFHTVGNILTFTAMHQMSHFSQLAVIRRRLGRSVFM